MREMGGKLPYRSVVASVTSSAAKFSMIRRRFIRISSVKALREV
jgi:hypothetical protein